MTEEKQGTETLQKETTPLDQVKKEPAKTEEKIEESAKNENHPPEGSKRWKEIYRKSKESEREIERLKSDIELLRQHNQKLAEMKEVELEVTKKVAADNTKDRIKKLRIEMKKAEQDMNWDRYVEYEGQIEELKEQLKPKPEPLKKSEINNNGDDDSVKTVVKKAVKKFTKETPWFDENSDEYDEIMADAAIMLDQKLMKSWDGSIEDRFAEVKKKIEDRFSYKSDGNGNVGLPSVAGVGNSQVQKSTKIELSPEQKRVASMLFPGDPKGEEKYYAQLQIYNKRRGK